VERIAVRLRRRNFLRLAAGAATLSGTPPEFRQLIADETAKWGKVVKFANLKAE
jgi:hypothetical protein